MDVARSLGLSRATVGFVLNDTPGQTIPESTRQRVLNEAKRLGYHPHSAARALASGRSHIVLLVLPDWPLDYSMRTHLDEASATLDRAGYALVTMVPHPDGQAQPLWETLRPDVVMGMTPFSPREIADIRASGINHVLTPAQREGPLPGEEGLLFADGPRVQVEHLAAQGRRTLAFAAPADPRLAQLSAERSGLAARTATRMPGITWAGDWTIDEGSVATAVAEWLSAGVDGVVAYNDDVAARIVGHAVRTRLRVPDRLAVIGHDDTPLARLFVPALSTIRVDTAGLGRYLAELALSTVNQSAPPVATPEMQAHLVARETT
ncbi:LacI family DNA-binding transcriptional regulator [Microbacterium sp. STN6]|uniref:LacI family DNA-binding transcriptional regulator n=1 Tax=Microbacterium sp. STN6 TaxID=2995588 RepID=UPI002260EC34|nr:LacI family DNA-binding transcriptional regulator [Microbacterium sp. STN6]MCX7523145.1 LacI family DNA-binding transcriptional regulator [Microbacterium sp. STN6]